MSTDDALTTLTAAIRAHGSPAAKQTLDWTARDFVEAWAEELDALDERGDCELSSRYTWHGRPVVVSL